MASFKAIPQFPKAGYEVNVFWGSLLKYVQRMDPPFVMEPDYQRGHVWSRDQQIAFVEFGLMGGESSMIITTNCPGWMRDFRGPYELIDGLQRVTAVLAFLRGEIPAFGSTIGEYEEELSLLGPSFRWRVLNLPTRKEVLKLYLLLNSGGVVHSREEIDRVRKLLDKEV
jgi:hypothetical protein